MRALLLALLLLGCQTAAPGAPPQADSPPAQALPPPADPPPAQALPPPAVSEASEAAACTSDADCAVFGLPRCINQGCGPPCGHVAHLALVALHRARAQAFLAEKEAAEKARCSVICLSCIGPLPVEVDPAAHGARCDAGRCAVVPRSGR